MRQVLIKLKCVHLFQNIYIYKNKNKKQMTVLVVEFNCITLALY